MLILSDGACEQHARLLTVGFHVLVPREGAPEPGTSALPPHALH